MFPLAEGFKPEIGQITHATALLVKNDRLPLAREVRVAGYSVGDSPQHRRLAHSARADQKRVLRRLPGFVLTDNTQQQVQQVPSGRKLGQEGFRWQERRIVESEWQSGVHG